MSFQQEVHERVYNYPTRHKMGFIREEYMKLLEEYPNINMERFWDLLNGITSMNVNGETVIFHRDIFIAIVYGVEDRLPNSWDWD